MLEAKFRAALQGRFATEQAQRIDALCQDHERLAGTPVAQFLDLLTEATRS